MPREVTFTPEQLAAAAAFLAEVQRTCEIPEDAVALFVYPLTEFLLQACKPDKLSVAVEETILASAQTQVLMTPLRASYSPKIRWSSSAIGILLPTSCACMV